MTLAVIVNAATVPDEEALWVEIKRRWSQASELTGSVLPRAGQLWTR